MVWNTKVWKTSLLLLQYSNVLVSGIISYNYIYLSWHDLNILHYMQLWCCWVRSWGCFCVCKLVVCRAETEATSGMDIWSSDNRYVCWTLELLPSLASLQTLNYTNFAGIGSFNVTMKIRDIGMEYKSLPLLFFTAMSSNRYQPIIIPYAIMDVDAIHTDMSWLKKSWDIFQEYPKMLMTWRPKLFMTAAILMHFWSLVENL